MVCPGCKRNQLIAAQMRGLADAILIGGLEAVGVPGGLAQFAPDIVEPVVTKKKKGQRPSAYNKEYAKQYAKQKKNHPKTAFKTLVKRAHKATRKRLN